jgi:F-type H+-transporting ATPase subunit b
MKKILPVVLFGALILSSFSSALAQTEGAPQERASVEHEQSPWQSVFRWANFLVLFGGLGYLLREPAREFFEGRRRNITSGLQRAQEAQTSAHARMDEIEQRLARLSTEVAVLRSEAEKESLTERDAIVAETKREVDRVIEQSRQEIERVARSVEREIKESVADMLVNRAGDALATEMTEDDQKRVVVRFIKKL